MKSSVTREADVLKEAVDGKRCYLWSVVRLCAEPHPTALSKMLQDAERRSAHPHQLAAVLACYFGTDIPERVTDRVQPHHRGDPGHHRSRFSRLYQVSHLSGEMADGLPICKDALTAFTRWYRKEDIPETTRGRSFLNI